MPIPPNQRRWHSTGAVGIRFDLSERHVRRLIASGDLKAITIGRVFRVSDEAIDEFALTHAVIPPPPPAAGVQLDLPSLNTNESAEEDLYTSHRPDAVGSLEQ